MGSIRTRIETGLLFMDFKFQGRRMREQTTLADSPANRKRLQKALDRIEAEIALGGFDYEKPSVSRCPPRQVPLKPHQQDHRPCSKTPRAAHRCSRRSRNSGSPKPR